MNPTAPTPPPRAESEALPCPFCSTLPRVETVGGDVPGMEDCRYESCYCPHCNGGDGKPYAGVDGEDRESVIAIWNRRTPAPHPGDGETPEMDTFLAEMGERATVSAEWFKLREKARTLERKRDAALARVRELEAALGELQVASESAFKASDDYITSGTEDKWNAFREADTRYASAAAKARALTGKEAGR